MTGAARVDTPIKADNEIEPKNSKLDDPNNLHFNLLELKEPEAKHVPLEKPKPLPENLPLPNLFFADAEMAMPKAAELPEKTALTAEEQQRADESRDYPELVLTRKAVEVFADRSTDIKQNWEKANILLHQAEQMVEKYIEGQGGIVRMFQNANQFAAELYSAIDQFKQGKRGISGPDSPTKSEDEKKLREQIKDFSKQDELSALRGDRGADLQKALFGLLNNDEKDSLDDVNLLLNKAQLVSSIRVRHALLANQFATATNDQTAKYLSEELLKGIAAIDPDTFKTSPEIHGLILQSEKGKPMDLSEGKAISTAFADEAQKTISQTQIGPAILLGAAAMKAGQEQAIRLIAAAISANPQVAKESWASFQLADKFQPLFDRSQKLVDAVKHRSSISSSEKTG